MNTNSSFDKNFNDFEILQVVKIISKQTRINSHIIFKLIYLLLKIILNYNLILKSEI